MVDLRVHHYLTGQKSAGSAQLGRVYPIDTLAHDFTDKDFSLAEKAALHSSL